MFNLFILQVDALPQFFFISLGIKFLSQPYHTSSIDASVALAMPGVVALISAKDVPGQNRRLWFNNPEELFAEDEVLQ